MDSYKRLDNLCKTFPDYPKGISSYIEVMERSNQIRHRCIGWSSDYDRLKKYRYIRNQIAHDNGIYEDEVCEPSDKEWLNAFYERIIEQTDPLCVYYKAQRLSAQSTVKPRTHAGALINTTFHVPRKTAAPPSFVAPQRGAHKRIGCIIALIATVSAVAICYAFIWWIMLHL